MITFYFSALVMSPLWIPFVLYFFSEYIFVKAEPNEKLNKKRG